jgi:hypothetical protein
MPNKPARRSPFPPRAVPLEPADALPALFTPPTAPAGPAKAASAKRDRAWDAQRSKATYDLPPALIQRIQALATELGTDTAKVKVSDVARLLIEAGLAQYERGLLPVQPRPTGFTLFDE